MRPARIGDDRAAPQQPLDQSVVLLATVDTLPWPYEILGLIEAAMSAGSGIVPTARLMPAQALAWAADAVIGIRLSQLGGIHLTGLNRVGAQMLCQQQIGRHGPNM